MKRRTITFEGARAQSTTTLGGHSTGSHRESLGNIVNPQEDVLYKERPEAAYHPGQGGQVLSTERKKQNQLGTLRHGYERLDALYSLGIPMKFEELQGRHPLDFVKETKEHYKLHPDPVKNPAQPEDTTLFDIREWLEPLLRKGQLYWDYCRDKWLEKESKLGAVCAPIGCIYSLWSFSHNCLQYGGLSFMAVYLVLTLVFIIPFIYMEMTIGQFHRQGLLKAIKQTCPLFQGLAYLMLLSSLFDYLLSMTRLSWLLYYWQYIVYSNLPWKVCDPTWSTSKCKETPDHDQLNIVYGKDERTPAVDWYRLHVTRPWTHWELNGKPSTVQIIAGILPNPRILLCYLVLLLIFRLLMKLWCKPLGTIMLGTFYAAFISFAFSLVAFHYTFPGHHQENVRNWLVDWNNLEYLAQKSTWAAAIRHAVIGSGIGTGIYITFGSHNTFPSDDLKRMSVLAGLTSFAVHCFIATFFILCFFNIRSTTALQAATEENFGRDVMFEMFPQVAAQHHQEGMGHVLLFAVVSGIILFASLRVLCSLHTIRQHFFDCYKEYYEPCRASYNYWEHDKNKRQQRYIFLHVSPKRKGELITKIMFFAGIFHVLTLIAGGSEVLFVIEDFWYNYVPVFIIMAESIAVFFLAGVRTLNDYVRKMTTRQVTLWYRFAWKMLIPFVLILYICTPPRYIGVVGGKFLPNSIRFTGYAAVGLPFFFLYMSAINTWRRSRAKGCSNKFLLEVTPEHEHAGMKAGRKPSTRLHWMHHLQVPAGISRGLSLPSYEGPPRKPDPNRFDFDNRYMNFLWYTLRLRCFNSIGCVNYGEEEDNTRTKAHMFPPIPFPMKPPKREPPVPEYLPNQAIKRVHKLKKYKDFHKQRKDWLNEKIQLESERMAAAHDERDITGIGGTTAAAHAKDEDEKREFFYLFDSPEEDGWDSTSSEWSEDSFDPSSDDGRGIASSPSVSTSDYLDSQDSLFRVSTEEEGSTVRLKVPLDSNSSSEEDIEPEEYLEGLEDLDELVAPAMDYEEGQGVPFEDETDSWDLEALENLEEEHGPGDKIETSEVETDTDDLIDALEVSHESAEEEEDSEDDDEEADDDAEDKLKRTSRKASKAGAPKKLSEAPNEKDHDSDEINSWSISCGSGESTCSSLYEDAEDSEGSEDEDSDFDESSSEEDDDPEKRQTDSSLTSADSEKTKNMKLKHYRDIAEHLDTFLHINVKKEKEKDRKLQEQLERARKENEKEKKKTSFM